MKKKTFSGSSLRELRQLAGLTIDEVAASAQVSASYLSAVENDKRTPSEQWVGVVAGSISSHLAHIPSPEVTA